MSQSPKSMLYSGTKLIDALAKQHEKRSKAELFKSGVFTLNWRSKVGSFPHPDQQTLVSAGEPCGAWNPHASRPEDKRTLSENLKLFEKLPLNGYVPAASIRGIVRAWVSQYPELVDRMQELFGYQTGTKIIAGKIEFLDAFPHQPTKLTLDITNPQQDFQVFHTGSTSPQSLYTLGDGHQKIEITIGIRGTRNAQPDDVATAWEWLQQALITQGIGSRTASGYGALIAPTGDDPDPSLPSLPVGYSSKKLGFTLYSQGSAGQDTLKPELRPTHWRGWLRSWLMRFLLGVMEKSDAEITVNELLGSLKNKGLVRLRVTINRMDPARNTPKFYRWMGSFEISAPTDILDEIILPIIKIAVRVGGVGRGWRRPLHRFILETKTGGKFDTARGCHIELTRSRSVSVRGSGAFASAIASALPNGRLTPTAERESRADIVTNQTLTKLDRAGNDLNLIYDVFRSAVVNNWLDRYLANPSVINAEVFSPTTCAVYQVPEPYQNPIDPKTLTWIQGETTATRGRGMELIYQLKYKRQADVGGKTSACSWVSIKRVNGAKPEDLCQEVVCIFMGNQNTLRLDFLADLAKIPGAVRLFGREA
jgi:CRISPR-associated protein Cmr6